MTFEATNALPPNSPTTRAMSRRFTTPERAKLPPVANEPARTPAQDRRRFARAKDAMKRTPEADLERAATNFLVSTAGARSKQIPSPPRMNSASRHGGLPLSEISVRPTRSMIVLWFQSLQLSFQRVIYSVDPYNCCLR
jgi:hypothetical protein